MNGFALEASVVGHGFSKAPVASAAVARVATEFAALPGSQPKFAGAGEEAWPGP